jgi:starvation-inducible DNA-binding protein
MANPYINDQVTRTEAATALGRLLADSYMLYLKTQGFHWNVVGSQFEPLHMLFQEQYSELAGAIDEIAERMRALGVKAPGSFSEFAALTSITEETGAPAADAMIGQLLSDHTAVSRAALQAVAAAEERGDVATADLATQRVMQHEKVAWMLGSLLQRWLVTRHCNEYYRTDRSRAPVQFYLAGSTIRRRRTIGCPHPSKSEASVRREPLMGHGLPNPSCFAAFKRDAAVPTNAAYS